MKSFSNFELFCPFLFVFLISKNYSTAEPQSVDPFVSIKESIVAPKPIVEQSASSNHNKISKSTKKDEQLVPFPIEEHDFGGSENHRVKPIEDSDIVLEGGAVSKLKSSTVTLSVPSNNNDEKIRVVEDSNRSTGSKGRKGVHYPVSSVVPRKGVNQTEVHYLNSTDTNLLVNNSGEKVSSNNVVIGNTSINSTEMKQSEDDKPQNYTSDKKIVTHAKKPEVVSDIRDIDDFDKYSIIKTSTTGEDYVIIGIVIVIGIWFSVFGALIFYRRAGEYWDRRHYRRMDFLVEGMYND